MKLYIAYGSNTNHELIASRCHYAEFIATTTIKNYRLEFDENENNFYLTIIPDENSEIETALDDYEGFPKLYRKEILDIKINGTTKQALPSESYFNCVLDGYVDCVINTEQLFNAMSNAKQL